MIMLLAQTGLRASELTALTLRRYPPRHRRARHHHGQGPQATDHAADQRRPPRVLRVWLARTRRPANRAAVPDQHRPPLTRQALARRLTKHAAHAAEHCPSLTAKTITPHVLRHTAAMRLLHAGVDTTVIALWLGHEQVETTQIYLHADLAIKEQALARTKPLDSKPGRYRPPDALLGFLDGL